MNERMKERKKKERKEDIQRKNTEKGKYKDCWKKGRQQMIREIVLYSDKQHLQYTVSSKPDQILHKIPHVITITFEMYSILFFSWLILLH